MTPYPPSTGGRRSELCRGTPRGDRPRCHAGRACVNTVRAVHAPLVDVVDIRRLDCEDRVLVGAEALIDSDAEQSEQVPEPGSHVHRVSGNAVREHDVGCLLQRLHKVAPRTTREQVVGGGVPGAGSLADRVRHPGWVHERHRPLPLERVRTTDRTCISDPRPRLGGAMLARGAAGRQPGARRTVPPHAPSPGSLRVACGSGGGGRATEGGFRAN